MKQIPYNNSAVPLRLEFPEEWDGKLVSAVSLTINDRDGNELLAADSATLYTATTLNGAVARYASQITLSTGSDNLSIGDPILLSGAAGDEVCNVKAYASLDVELEGFVDRAFDDGDDVYGLFCDYSLDVSNTNTFTDGIVLVLTWTPTGSGNAITQMVQVASSSADLTGLRGLVNDIYPRVYDALTKSVDKFDRVAATAERRIGRELRVDNLDIQRIKDQDELLDAMAAGVAYLWLIGADKDKEDERNEIKTEYDNQIRLLKALPIWTDDDLDKIEDDEEITDHEFVFERGW